MAELQNSIINGDLKVSKIFPSGDNPYTYIDLNGNSLALYCKGGYGEINLGHVAENGEKTTSLTIDHVQHSLIPGDLYYLGLKNNKWSSAYIYNIFAGPNAENITPITGTWTPTFRGLSSAGSWSYGSRSAKYYKIGKLVHFEVLITATRTSGGSGELYMTLPVFSVANGGTATGSMGYATSSDSATNSEVRKYRYVQIQSNGVTFRGLDANNMTIASDVSRLGQGKSFTLHFSGTYISTS